MIEYLCLGGIALTIIAVVAFIVRHSRRRNQQFDLELARLKNLLEGKD